MSSATVQGELGLARPKDIEMPRAPAATARIKFIGSVLLFRATLDICYVLYVSDVFADDPVTPLYLNIDLTRLSLSYVAVLALASVVQFDKKNLNGIFFFVALAFLFVPMTSIVGLNADRDPTGLLATGLAILICWALLVIGSPRRANLNANVDLKRAVLVSSVFVGAFLIWSVLSGAVFIGNLNLSAIYSLREDASNILDVGMMAYVNLWAQKVFTPFLLAVALLYRQRGLAVACVCLQLYFFFVTQHRAHLFVPVLICLVYLLYMKPISIAGVYVVLTGALLGILFASMSLELEEVPAIVIRRAFFVAASISLDWISYFKTAPHVFFSDSLLANFVRNEYTGQNLPYLMNDLLVSGEPSGMNAGFVATGFAHVGFLGVVGYSIVLSAIVAFINHLIAHGRPVFIAAAVLVMPLRTAWADSDLFTSILSHGLLIASVLLCLCGTSKELKTK